MVSRLTLEEKIQAFSEMFARLGAEVVFENASSAGTAGWWGVKFTDLETQERQVLKKEVSHMLFENAERDTDRWLTKALEQAKNIYKRIDQQVAKAKSYDDAKARATRLRKKVIEELRTL